MIRSKVIIDTVTDHKCILRLKESRFTLPQRPRHVTWFRHVTSRDLDTWWDSWHYVTGWNGYRFVDRFTSGRKSNQSLFAVGVSQRSALYGTLYYQLVISIMAHSAVLMLKLNDQWGEIMPVLMQDAYINAFWYNSLRPQILGVASQNAQNIRRINVFDVAPFKYQQWNFTIHVHTGIDRTKMMF